MPPTYPSNRISHLLKSRTFLSYTRRYSISISTLATHLIFLCVLLQRVSPLGCACASISHHPMHSSKCAHQKYIHIDIDVHCVVLCVRLVGQWEPEQLPGGLRGPVRPLRVGQRAGGREASGHCVQRLSATYHPGCPLEVHQMCRRRSLLVLLRRRQTCPFAQLLPHRHARLAMCEGP